MASDPDRNSGPPIFPVTHWTMIGRAGESDPAGSRAALDELLRVYLPALRTYLTSVRRMEEAEADDLLQSFVAAKFLESNLAAGAEQGRGKFRTLLLTSLERFMISQWRRTAARKRGGGRSEIDLEQIQIPAGGQPGPGDLFEIAWARELLGEVTRRMQAECERTGHADFWGVFESRILGPIIDGTEPADYTDLVQRFGLKSPAQASNVLVTAKRMFQRILRLTVAEYAHSEPETEEEIRDLQRILSRAAGRA